MHRTIRPHRLALTLAAATALTLTATEPTRAAPITGQGLPVATEQPSLGLTYLIRTQDPTNFAGIGQVIPFAGNSAPGGFAIANGQLESIVANPVLFAQIGTTYGGNGTSNFALPDLSGRTVVGTGQGAGLANRALGSTAGATTQTLTANELPPFGGASGLNAGNRSLPTSQPSIALTQAVVTRGFFPATTGAPASGPLIGQVLTYAGNALPTGQLAANGQQLPINQYQALFSVLGNTYGGNAFINFGLPNLAGRAATGVGSAPGLTPQTLGEFAGAVSTLLTTANLPPQLLTLPNGKTGIVGGGQPFGLQQPTLALQYIIAVQGAFPSPITFTADGLPFLGEISLFAGSQAPAGWDFANGQLLSIASNPALFSIIGNTYGGNGFSSFALPDLRDRLAVGTGNGVRLGDTFGSPSETLTYAQLPVGYPAALTIASNVPEPPAIAILLVALLALAWRRQAGFDHRTEASAPQPTPR